MSKKAGLEEKKRNASSSHEENRLFLPTRKAREEIKKFCGEDIRIFNNLFPAFNSNIIDDIIFCALHRSYKLGKASSALGSKMREKLTNILEQIRNRAYTSNPWSDVLGASIFAEWPLKEYGLRLKGYSENLQNIKQPETSWGQRAWQALGRFFTQGRDAEVPERHGWLSDGQYNEENRKIAEAERKAMSFGQFNRQGTMVDTAPTASLKNHKSFEKKNSETKYSEDNLIQLGTTRAGEKVAGLDKLDLSFRSNLILYLGKFREESPMYAYIWPITLNSTYRDANDQARVMVIALGNLTSYAYPWKRPCSIIQYLYDNKFGLETPNFKEALKGCNEKLKEFLAPYVNRKIDIFKNNVASQILIKELINGYIEYGLVNLPSDHMTGKAADLGISNQALFNFLMSPTTAFKQEPKSYIKRTFIHLSGI